MCLDPASSALLIASLVSTGVGVAVAEATKPKDRAKDPGPVPPKVGSDLDAAARLEAAQRQAAIGRRDLRRDPVLTTGIQIPSPPT